MGGCCRWVVLYACICTHTCCRHLCPVDLRKLAVAVGHGTVGGDAGEDAAAVAWAVGRYARLAE